MTNTLTTILTGATPNLTDAITELTDAIPAGRFLANAAILAILALIVLAATIIDMSDALITARRTGRQIRSHSLRKTVAKISEYWRVLLAGFLADSVCCFTEYYDLPYAAIMIALGLVVIEIKSLIEHARVRKSAVKDLPEALGETIRIAAKMRGHGNAATAAREASEELHRAHPHDPTDTATPREER